MLIRICLVMILMASNLSWAMEGIINRNELSLKAGPTEPGEKLSLVWIEALVYPKMVKTENTISLGVRTTSAVKKVKANFDFSSQTVNLVSLDGKNWNGVLRLPRNITAGLHFVRYRIYGEKGDIQRTVEFFVAEAKELEKKQVKVSYGEVIEPSSFPLTVTATCSVLVKGKERILFAGQKIKGISRVPWYLVELEDGSSAWLSSTYVNDPVEEGLADGIKAYQANDFAWALKRFNAVVELDPHFAKGYYWLAKTYKAKNQLEEAANALLLALELDARDLEFRVLAGSLARQYLALGDAELKRGNYRSAAAAFQRSLELYPNYVASQTKLAKCLKLLEGKDRERIAVAKNKSDLKIPPKEQVKMINEESLAMVKSTKTKKGSSIESAIKSVVTLTRSLGTPVLEKGWQVKVAGEKILVQYLCEQGGGVLESFDWLVDVDTRQVLPNNENAQLLMSRW